MPSTSAADAAPSTPAPLDAALPARWRGPRWTVWITWLGCLLAPLSIALLAPQLLRGDRVEVGLASPGLWATLVTLAALSLFAIEDLSAPDEDRSATPDRHRQRVIWRGVIAPLLALPMLAIIAVAPVAVPSLWRGPLLPMIAAPIAALAAAALCWRIIARIAGAGAMLRGVETPSPRRARALYATARALIDALRGEREARDDDASMRFELRAGIDRGAHLFAHHHDLKVRVYPRTLSVEAEEGHLPRSHLAQLQALAESGVRLAWPSSRHALLAIEDDAARGALTEAGTILLNGWSRRVSPRGEEQTPREDDADPTPTPERREMSASQFAQWSNRAPLLRSLSSTRRLLAALLLAAIGWTFAEMTVAFPIWEGNLAWWPSFIVAAVGVLVIHPMKLPWRPSMVSARPLLQAGVLELLDLFWALRVSSNALVIELSSSDVSLDRFALGDVDIEVRFRAPNVHATLSLRPSRITPLGLEVIERLTLEAVPDQEEDDLGRLLHFLETQRWPFTLTPDEDGGGPRLTLSTRRVVGSGRGAWRHLTWALNDELLMLGLEDAPSGLISPEDHPVEPTRTRRLLSRSPLARTQALLLSALVIGLLAAPRLGADQFPLGAHADQPLTLEALDEGGLQSPGDSGALAAQCPADVEASTLEALTALRCLASAAGQPGSLSALNWSDLLAPLAQVIDVLDEMVRADPPMDCARVSARLEALFDADAMRFTIAVLERHHPPSWRALRFYWPDSLMRRGRRLRWQSDHEASVDSLAHRCPRAIPPDTLEAMKRLYQLSAATFSKQLDDGGSR